MYENGIKKCDEEINRLTKKLSTSDDNDYLKSLFNTLIDKEMEKKKQITERFERLKSVDK